MCARWRRPLSCHRAVSAQARTKLSGAVASRCAAVIAVGPKPEKNRDSDSSRTVAAQSGITISGGGYARPRLTAGSADQRRTGR